MFAGGPKIIVTPLYTFPDNWQVRDTRAKTDDRGPTMLTVSVGACVTGINGACLGSSAGNGNDDQYTNATNPCQENYAQPARETSCLRRNFSDKYQLSQMDPHDALSAEILSYELRRNFATENT